MVLPFLDLTLIAVNAAVGIVFAVFLSIFVLGEKLIPKYDISGLFFILLGSSGIVLLTNKVEQEFTGEQVKKIVLSLPSFVLIFSGVGLFIINLLIMCRFAGRLRRFEKDVEDYAA